MPCSALTSTPEAWTTCFACPRPLPTRHRSYLTTDDIAVLRDAVDGRLAHVRCRYSGKFIWNTARILCEYSGHIDEQGRPDGFGVWDDQHPQGESLEGYWKNGLPVRPLNGNSQHAAKTYA